MTDLPVVGGAMGRPKLDKDFGDTVAVMLTLTSPPVSDFEVDRRAEALSGRSARRGPRGRLSVAPGATPGSSSTPRRSPRT